MAARAARRDLLLLAALLHDIAKGRPGDHSVVGEDLARGVAARIGIDASGVDDLGWVVRNHLLLADTATRRDLGDDRTISKYAAEVRTSARNALLYALTIGDSRATGPAAWNVSKASLVRELFAKADARLAHRRRGRRGPGSARRAGRAAWAKPTRARSSTRCRRATRARSRPRSSRTIAVC